MRLTIGFKISIVTLCIILIDAGVSFFVRKAAVLCIVAAISVLAAIVLAHLIALPVRRLAKLAPESISTIDPGRYPDDESRTIAATLRKLADQKNANGDSPEARQLAFVNEKIASVRHSINNPLMIIAGNAQILEVMMAESPDDQKQRIRSILQETERLGQITKTLSDLKQLRASGTEAS